MHRMLLTTMLAVLATSAFAPLAVADDTPPADPVTLPDMVITATRVPTLIENIPAGVTVIDRATIEERGYTTLVDALAAVPGMRVAQSGGPGGNASVFLRGTDSNHVLVLRDGVPINDPSDPGGAFNFGVNTLDDVERIEVVRGPMSSLYGSGAIGGVINLISRKGSGEPHAYAEVAAGLPLAAKLAAGLAGSTGPFDYSLNAATQNSIGFDSTPRRESVYTGARNPFQSSTASINLGYTPIEGTRVSLALGGRTSSFKLDELGSPAYDASDYRGTDNSFNGRLALDSHLFDGIWETSLVLNRLETDRHYSEPLEAADPNMMSSDSRYHGRRTDLQWNNTVHIPDAGPATNSALVFGASHTQDNSNSVYSSNSPFGPYQNNVRASASSNDGHVGLQTTLANRLTLTADLRDQDARYGGSATTWRAGAVLAVPEIWSHLKASYGTAFLAPSLFDLFGVDAFGYVGNPKLRPETSKGYELGWTTDIAALGRPNAATIEVTYFNNRIHNLIQTVFAPVYTTDNVDRARTQGIESSLTLRPTSYLEASLAYTWTEARDLTTNTALLRRPHDQITAELRATPLPGLTIAPELIYTGAFQDYIIDDTGNGIGTGRAHPGTIVNLTTTYAITANLTAYITVQNLGDSHFEPVSGFQTPGTSGLLGLRARF